MKRPLIAKRSCPQTTSASEGSHSQTEGESTPFELEKSGLSHEYYFDCAELAASTHDTIGVTHAPAFNFNQRGLGLAEFINFGCDFSGASTVTTIQNENQIKTKCEGGQDVLQTQTQTQTQTDHPTAPVIDTDNKIGSPGVGLREINSGIFCENNFYYHVNDTFDDYFNETFNDTYFHHL